MTTKDERIAAINLAIERGGGVLRFAKSMNVTHQAVYNWKKRGWVPAERSLTIETIFGVERSRLMDPKLVRAVSTPPAHTF